jgi:hypothetical protein
MAQATDDNTTTADNVHPFPGAGSEPPPRSKAHPKARLRRRTKVLTEVEALARLREAGRIEVESIATLGALWGWERSRTSKAVTRWERAGIIVREPGTGGNVIIRVHGDVHGGVHAPADDIPASPITPDPPPDRPKDVVQPPHVQALPIQPAERHVDWTTALAALALACVSAGFSIYGFTSIFVGAFGPVIAMGVALEAGKLRAVAWIGHHRTTPWWGLKSVLTGLVAVLMILNAVGCYGFLSKAHIAAQVAVEAVGTTKKAGIESNISTKKGEIANFSTQITQIDAAISKATEKGRTNAAMQLSVDQNRRRTELATKLAQANTELAALNVQMATANGAQKVAEADLGQVRYLATLLGVEDELVLRWFILLVAALLDPAAVLLLLAATRR